MRCIWSSRAAECRKAVSVELLFLIVGFCNNGADQKSKFGLPAAMVACAERGLGKVFEHDGLELQYRRLLVQGYWIFYELAGEDVIVRRVIHESQDLDDYALI